MNKFYVYGHYIDGDDSPFYIGKGSSRRAYELCNRSTTWNKCRDGKDVIIQKLAENLTNSQALLLEEELINKYKPTANLVKTGVVKHIDYDEISSVLYYDETSPTMLRWKIDRAWNGIGYTCRKDAVAGVLNQRKNLVVVIDKIPYYGTRLIWVLNNKNINKDMVIDHIDGNKANNKISNLQEVSYIQNGQNRKNLKNKSGAIGVYKTKNKNTIFWVAQWTDMNGKRHKVSFSVTRYSEDLAKNLAIEARNKAIEELNKLGANYTERHNEVNYG